ncbi:Fe(3+)-hydroxamate ABC transporter substrate-binding protein FhuD [Pantoea sp. 1.19]|uniref:Fe(3+)-hydroxamate ABC transporter substrate-binding protein FhuD n=1 Tax=Pantoea sp. 1.19 TaxID=1925589 RepID=UPI000948FCBA|nr:Fe(3+)-hydroxamate ABC transporter substrate-binding protein FhuD [Pantoea sp. 1.19]
MNALSRRRLLTAMALSPLLLSAPLRAAAPPDPTRVVALEWLPAELLLALGVTPMGVADIPTWRQWVQEPALPATVMDVGLRTEPNMELLTQMHPSLLLYSRGYGPSPQALARIAPGMAFDFNDGSGQPLAVARRSLLALGERLGMADRAEAHLADVDRTLAATRQRLARFADRPLLLMTLMDTRHALVLGENSLFAQVLQALGLQNAWRGDTNFWGSAQVGIEQLAGVRTARAICFDHDNAAVLQQLAQSPLWQSLPFIRQRQFVSAPGVWLYGATLSALRFCRVLEHALEAS